MKQHKYVESNVPAGCRLKVIQLPIDGLYVQKRGTYIPVNYLTLATLYKDGKVVGKGMAKCTEQAPTRKVGRAIAVGRALKHYLGSTGA